MVVHTDSPRVQTSRRLVLELLGSAVDLSTAPDALRYIEQYAAEPERFGPDSLTGVRVFFPDPWPKARHHKRRLLQPDTLALIADRLRPGGVLHAATDHAGYAEQIAECGDAEPLLRRVTAEDYLPISVTRPITKYETKAHDAGSAISELLWERLPR